MYNILIIYHYDNRYEYPLRPTTRDHLYCFGRYSGHRCFYLNLAFGSIPYYMTKIKFDLVIFHTNFLSTRWNPSLFQQLAKKTIELKTIHGIRIAMPQDEYIYTDILCDFINAFKIDYVFSVSPESEWSKIYHKVNHKKTQFYKILTGYSNDHASKQIRNLNHNAVRSIDIGYRARHAAPWLGRHGLLKVKIGEIFQQEAPKRGLSVDISTRQQDTLLGNDWYKFLLRCKYTIGVSGGASILDRDGSIKAKTENYLRLHPLTSFEEIEQSCFPTKDGNLDLSVITPRNFEACATRTCQILIEGDYNGILEPGKHYIELRRDFSNLNQVLDLVKEDSLRERITSNAYKDIVESGRYTYREMVKFILEKSLGHEKIRHRSLSRQLFVESLLYFWADASDRFDWMRVALLWRKGLGYQRLNRFMHAVLPVPVILFVRRSKKMLRKDQ